MKLKLKVKEINLASGGPMVAVLNKTEANKWNFEPTDRIKISHLQTKKGVVAVVDISDKGVKPGEIGLFDEVIKKLNIQEGTNVKIKYVHKPTTINLIRKKLDGVTLNANEINKIVKDIVENRFSDIELTYFVSACYSQGLTLKESAALTNAIVETGEKLSFNSKYIVDKHCAGGVPNNRTTMIVVPILAELGYKFPKTSSRAITSPAGTADTMEVLAPVSLKINKIKKIIDKINACIIWGGSVNLAAADDILIKVRHPLSLDPEGMLLASILAKKKAVGATHVVIDLPFGEGSKFPSKRYAKKLGKKFKRMGKLLNMKIKVVYTNGSQPIGNGIGPALEARDVIDVLKGNGPKDLRKKSLYLATELLKMVDEKNAKRKAQEVLDSGRAFKKFQEIIVAQGGSKDVNLPKAKYHYDVRAKKSAKVKSINNKKISKIARLAGAPKDQASGIYLRVKENSLVNQNDVIYTIYAQKKLKFDYLISNLDQIEPITFF